jgi:hypothetical protein
MAFKISKVSVNGLHQAIVSSGYPMSVDTNYIYLNDDTVKRFVKLGSSPSGSAHDCILKGVIVLHDINASQTFWQQWQRYHFHDIASSQSKMHRINTMGINSQCNEYVTKQSKDQLNNLVDIYNNDKTQKNYLTLLYNVPMGLELNAFVVTNYLQLKSIYYQRKNHRLDEWKEYCKWIETLPHMKEILKT